MLQRTQEIKEDLSRKMDCYRMSRHICEERTLKRTPQQTQMLDQLFRSECKLINKELKENVNPVRVTDKYMARSHEQNSRATRSYISWAIETYYKKP